MTEITLYDFPFLIDTVEQTCFEGVLSKKKPRGIMLGGQPASGKSSMIHHIVTHSDHPFAIINGDELRRYHPLYHQINSKNDEIASDKTQSFANFLSEHLLSKSIDYKYPLIIEGTMRNAQTPLKTATELKKNGFITEAHVIAAHPEMSLLGIYKRYEEQKALGVSGRFSSLEIHNSACKQMPDTVDILYKSNLVDHIVVYDFQATKIIQHYDRSNPKKWNDIMLPSQLIREVQTATLTPIQCATMVQDWARIYYLRNMRGVNDNEIPKQKIGHFINLSDPRREKELTRYVKDITGINL